MKSTNYPYSMIGMTKNILLLAFLLIYTTKGFSQEWTVPDENKAKVAPFKFDDSVHKAGEQVFQRNCISCHGTPGKSNFVKLNPSPEDPASEKFQKETDGSLYYKITNGRGAMPSFKNVLTEQERWQVISYIRTFHKNYIQPEPPAFATGKYSGIEVITDIKFDSVNKQFNVLVRGAKDKDTTSLSDLEIALYAKRYFGQLQIDESKITDKSGSVLFNYSNPLPGDKDGNLIVFAKINAEGLSDLKKEVTVQAGTPMTAGSLIDTRAMWTISRHAPIWLIMAYSLVVAGVWAFLIYIVLQIAKIKKLGKQPKTTDQ